MELSQRDLAAHLGLSTQQIRNLEDKGIPHRAEGRRKLYPVPESIQWYVQFKVDEALGRRGDADFAEARARREYARARLAEMEVGQAEGELVSKEVVDEVFGTKLLDVLRSSVLNLPGRWGAQIVGLSSPREGEAVLKKMAVEFLEHLSGPVADDFEAGASLELPEDCPGRSVLMAAGVEMMSDLLGIDDLQEIPGIGPVTEEKIRAWMGEDHGRAA